MSAAPGSGDAFEAVVLAGGLGTRLRSVVPNVPKPMAPVAGRPFLEILLGRLAKAGVARVVLAVSWRAEVIERHFGRHFGSMDLVYSVEDAPLGTGGGLRQALAMCSGGSALVANGDTSLDLDIAALRARWHQDRVPLIVGRQVDDTARFGSLRCEGERLVGFEPRAPSDGAVSRRPGLINSGHYWLPTDLLEGWTGAPAFSFEADFLPRAVSERRFEVVICEGDFIDIGVPEDYARAQVELADR